MTARVRKDKFVQAGPPALVPATERQALLVAAIRENQVVVTTGYPGTGKTFVPTILAADAFALGTSRGGVDKIILTRPNVESGRSIGFRPGTMLEKMEEWFAEILGLLRERLGPGAVDIALKHQRIQVVPFETMRGRSFSRSFILLDEAQNTTPHEMKMFTTRLGEDIRCVINGDIRQSDLRSASGLKTLVDIIRAYDMPIPVIEFGASDIVRSALCRDFFLNFMDWESK